MDGTQSVYSKNFSMKIDFFPQLLGEEGKPFQVKNKLRSLKMLYRSNSDSTHSNKKDIPSKLLYLSTYINERKLSLESDEIKLEISLDEMFPSDFFNDYRNILFALFFAMVLTGILIRLHQF